MTGDPSEHSDSTGDSSSSDTQTPEDRSNSSEGVIREINVGFRENLDESSQAQAEKQVQDTLPQGSAVVNRNRTLGYITIKLPDGSPEDKATVKSRLEKRSDVEYAEDNEYDQVTATPNDPEYSDQYGPDSVNAPQAWECTFGDSSITIGVSDTGIMYDHQDLAGNMDDSNYSAPSGANQSYNASHHGWDFVGDDNDPYPVDLDQEEHGTHVAGILGAVTDNNQNVAGMSDCSILSMRTLDSSGAGTHSDITDALQWATDQGADVINMSHGGSDSDTKKKGVDYAHNNGVVLVASAGNTGPCSDCVGYPAAYPEVLAISNIDQNDQLVNSSSTGPQVELAAPGDSILSTVPSSSSTTDTERFTGTSMSSPLVAGVAGLVLSMESSLSKSEVEDILTSTAEDIGLADNEQGSGKVDAEAAVLKAGVGDQLGTVTLPGNLDDNTNANCSVAGTFDGTYYSTIKDDSDDCADSTLQIFEPPDDGDGDATLIAEKDMVDSNGNSIDISALVWDPTRRAYWAGWDGNTYLIDRGDPTNGSESAVATYKFDSSTAHGDFKIVDGLAYDGSQDSLWYSADISDSVFLFDLPSGSLQKTLTPETDANGNQNGELSGIAVGADKNDRPTLYLGRNGEAEIVRVYSDDGSFISVFAENVGARTEDLSCDPITYEPKTALLAKDARNDIYEAYAVPDETCQLPVGVTVADTTIAVGGEATLDITADNVSHVSYQKLWTDWTLVSENPDGGTVTNSISDTGEYVIEWPEIQQRATPSITVAPPSETYIGGAYVITVAVAGGPHSDTKTLLLDIE